MAAPSGTTWGSIVGSGSKQGRIGIYVSVSNSNTQSTVSIQVYFWSRYAVSDSGNNFLSISPSQQKIYNEFKEKIKIYYEMFNHMLPKIICFSNDMILKNRYTYDNITKKEDISGLSLLLSALDFSEVDLKEWLTTSDGALKQKHYTKFKSKIDNLNSEYLIPEIINSEIKQGNLIFKVKGTDSKWYGVTYKEDKPVVVAAIQSLKDAGLYPEKLW